jgi:putative peptidoglycan lipid II flippase
MSVGTMLSRVFGFIRDALIFALFDRTVTDAFVVGFRIPNLFRRIFGEGSLSVSFIPVFVDYLNTSPDPAKAKQLSDATFSALMTVTTTLSLLLFVYMDVIVKLLVGNEAGYVNIPGKLELTVYLSRIMVLYLILVTTYAYFMAICNALNHFFWPAFAPALYNLFAIAFSLFPNFGVKGEVLAWGVVAGGLGQFLITAWVAAKIGFFPKWTFKWRGTGFSWVLKNMGPGVFGLGIYQVMTLVNTRFAAGLAEGSQSYIYAADRVLELPQSLIAISLGTALLPRYSEYLAKKEPHKLIEEARSTLRLLLYLSIPSAIGMYFLAVPLTDVLFRRGSFNTNDTYQTALVVQVYSVLLLASSISKVTVPAFYAMKNTRLPAMVAAVVLVVHIILGRWLVNSYGLVGLSCATAVSGFLNMFILQVIFNSRFGNLGDRQLWLSLAQMIPASTALWALCVFGHPWLKDLLHSRVLTLGVDVVVGALIYFVVSYGCRSPEAEKLLGRFFGRLPKMFFLRRG